MVEAAERIALKLKELPDSPGVYQLKDSRGRILYIGKALSLKSRVPTYFQASARQDLRIRHFVRRIADLDWIIVPSELDALMLESSLVRQFQPPFNTLLKDDKSYPYVKITLNEPFPRVMLTRSYEADKAKYWGPLTSVREVRSAVRFIASLFQLRTCSLELDGKRQYPKPCLDYHLKICSGPCASLISREEYRRLVGFAVEFFNGHYSRVMDELKRRMQESAEQRLYESAARYRDLIAAAEKSIARQRVIGKPGEELDVVGIARSRDRACVLLFVVRDGRVAGDRKFVLKQALDGDGGQDGGRDVLAAFFKLHYANPQSVPSEIVLPYAPSEAELLAQWLARLRASAQANTGAGSERAAAAGAVKLTVPRRGHKRELLEMAMRNAEEHLHTVLLGEAEDFVVSPGQQALAEHLGLAAVPRRIEGYDVACLHGCQATGAMVVFVGGRKAGDEYRTFNIRLKSTPDDYAMLRETLQRRLRRLLADPAWAREVDLIMVDGGKGQLSTAQAVLDEFEASVEFSTQQKERIAELKLISLAKQEETIFHYGLDGAVSELRLPHTDAGLRLLVAVRDEAHRACHAQHVRMRDKAMRLGVLETIPALGPQRRAALIAHFGSVKRLREADASEIAEVKGIGPFLAAHIRRYLDRDIELEEGKAKMKREMRIVRDGRKSRG